MFSFFDESYGLGAATAIAVAWGLVEDCYGIAGLAPGCFRRTATFSSTTRLYSQISLVDTFELTPPSLPGLPTPPASAISGPHLEWQPGDPLVVMAVIFLLAAILGFILLEISTRSTLQRLQEEDHAQYYRIHSAGCIVCRTVSIDLQNSNIKLSRVNDDLDHWQKSFDTKDREIQFLRRRMSEVRRAQAADRWSARTVRGQGYELSKQVKEMELQNQALAAKIAELEPQERLLKEQSGRIVSWYVSMKERVADLEQSKSQLTKRAENLKQIRVRL